MEGIIEEVRQERKRQDEKWGVQNHSPAAWNLILTEEVGESAKAILEWMEAMNVDDANKSAKNYRDELIQIAAVAIATIEYLDRMNNG